LPKKCCLGPQNGSGSLGPEKLLKIVNYATIKETKKLKETMVGVQVELAGGHQYPLGLCHPFTFHISTTHNLEYQFIFPTKRNIYPKMKILRIQFWYLKLK